MTEGVICGAVSVGEPTTPARPAAPLPLAQNARWRLASASALRASVGSPTRPWPPASVGSHAPKTNGPQECESASIQREFAVSQSSADRYSFAPSSADADHWASTTRQSRQAPYSLEAARDAV